MTTKKLKNVNTNIIVIMIMIIAMITSVIKDNQSYDNGDHQALQYRIWNLGPSSKKLHKGKIWDFGTKLGLFWDHFYTLLVLLVVVFIKMLQNLQKAKKALKTV